MYKVPCLYINTGEPQVADRRYLTNLTLLEVANQRKLRHDGRLSHCIRYLIGENSMPIRY